MILGQLFTALIYQPFLNILVFFYWLMDVITAGHPDMGVAVILMTLVLRVILLPISLMEDKNEKDRRSMLALSKELEEKYAGDPVLLRHETKKLFRRNGAVVWGETISLAVQVAISLMLWRIFETGLVGEDLHLLYRFMPEVATPYNLVFLGRFDLTHTNFILNIIQSVMIFLVETLAIVTSPYPPMKGEVVRLQLVLPILSFIIFMRFPAGKKLFVITTLAVSLMVVMYKYLRRRYHQYLEKRAAAAAAAAAPTSAETPLVQEIA